VLWPANDRTHYYRCVHQQWGGWQPQEMCCPSGFVFNRCQHMCMWQWHCQNPCCGGPSDPTTTQSPASTTTSKIPDGGTTPAPVPVELCQPPQCNSNELVILWPRQVPNEYYECTGLFSPVVRSCGTGQLFNFFLQNCLPANQWLNVCPMRSDQ
jgi:hypothetical protein